MTLKLRDILNLPLSSYDIIGNVAIVWVPDKYMDKAPQIAKAIMNIHKRVKAVYRKNPIEGDYRIRKLELIGGIPIEETEAKEHGIRLKLNIHKVFYSPRMSTDRLRIAEKIQPYERILVPFAGIGPYALLAAKKEPTARVVGIELNPDAVKYFKQNIKINKLSNVIAIEGDAAKEVFNWRRWADRIIMPIPMYAEQFLRYISEAIGKRTYIYVYIFVDSSNPIEHGKQKIEESLNMPFLLVSAKKLRSYSKNIDEYVFEILTTEDFHHKALLRKKFISSLKQGKLLETLDYAFISLDKLNMLEEIKRKTDIIIGVWEDILYNPGVDYVITPEQYKKLEYAAGGI